MPADILRAEEEARKLLLAQNPAAIPVRVERLRLPAPVLFDSVESFCRVTNTTVDRLDEGSGCLRDGCTVIARRGGRPLYLVLYNEKEKNLRRRSFTLAHEVGHILLGHTQDGDKEEREANAFAAELLMPRALARELRRRLGNPPDVDRELARIFATSLTVARLRLQGMREASAELEERLLKRYGPLLPHPDLPDLL